MDVQITQGSAGRRTEEGVDSPDALAAAAQDFEAFVLKLLLAQLRKGITSGGLFEDHSSDTRRAMVEDALAQRAAESGTFGLAQQLIADIEAKR